MNTHLIDVILLIVQMILLTVTVLMQCASGERMKKSNSKSKVTQSSASSSESVKKTSKLQENKKERIVKKSSKFLPKSNEPTEKESVNLRKLTDETFWSNKSDRSNESREEEKSNNPSAKIFKESLIVIPTVADKKQEDIQIAKPVDGKSVSNEEVKKVIFKEQEQSTQEIVGLTDAEEEQELSLEPKNLRWNDEGGYQTVQLKNITKDRLAIKAKCSDNQLYRVNPVFGFIDPGKELKVDIMRQKALPKVDKMIFVSVHANKDEIFPKPLFKRSKDCQKITMLPLLIARAI